MWKLQMHDVPWWNPPAALACCDRLTHFLVENYHFDQISMVKNCTGLHLFSLSYGQLEEFPDLSSNMLLKYVDVSYNKISTLDPNKLPQSGHLRTLWLGHNMFVSMPDLSQVFPQAFSSNIVVRFVLFMSHVADMAQESCIKL